MLLSTLKPVTYRISPVTGAKEVRLQASKVSMMKRSQAALPPLQGNEEEKWWLQESFKGASRREMMQMTAASLGLLSLPSPARATEAYTKDTNIMQRVIEEFQEILKKAGSMKPEDEALEKKPDAEAKVETAKKEKPIEGGEAKTGQEKKPDKEAKVEAEKKATTKGKPDVPALPSIINDGKTVETALP